MYGIQLTYRRSCKKILITLFMISRNPPCFSIVLEVKSGEFIHNKDAVLYPLLRKNIPEGYPIIKSPKLQLKLSLFSGFFLQIDLQLIIVVSDNCFSPHTCSQVLSKEFLLTLVTLKFLPRESLFLKTKPISEGAIT